ncbi:aconitate hydratase [Thermanaerosceptrum fracticalcis]|uniref:Aconitate hydratase n=1 Tax=Thermanaerosceptrum fracticalcis TaxID=1712410 RepID=A0A7G6E7I2_THEFR|nr:aconitate hydratase [Thermanaerosceptrum fracticalcis]QNB48036.1 aconitate hydratase [Thermanaerosceptrum fracticalcis]
MSKSLAVKIIEQHLLSGKPVAGEEIALKIDQTLTQDTTGTMTYLQFQALGFPKVKTKRSVAYIDHNTLQVGFENADDHRYIQTVAAKHGIYFSRPGNGICHQVHLERFGKPGETLLGSDSHTPTCGGLGMLAIGAGGLDVAVAMGGGAYYLTMPKIVNIELLGKLPPWVTAKDIILEVLRRLTVKGGVGKIFEYTGEGITSLSVPERATIANMGAELGATTSIFPSDHVTYEFLKAQNRVEDWRELLPDQGACYDEKVTIDLSQLEPLVACPHSPDNVVPVKSVEHIKLNQVCIGSCTNSSYMDLMKVAKILEGHTVHPSVSLVIAPGSKQVFTMLAENGVLSSLIQAGARILECACGPCIGMGQAPVTDGVSLRTFNRNYQGRSGTASAQVYLCSPEVAAISALTGHITDPRSYPPVSVEMPFSYHINDNLIVPPARPGEEVEVILGPNIKPFPQNTRLPEVIKGRVLLKMGDHITTDHIMPSPAWLLPLRSNIPALSDHCLTPVDKEFPNRARNFKGGFLVAGENYGQGSSREHAALVPLYLGIKGVIALSFARIHMANLINSGILPLTFVHKEDYERISLEDELVIDDLHNQVLSGNTIAVKNITQNFSFKVRLDVSERLRHILLAGGLLPYTKGTAH